MIKEFLFSGLLALSLGGISTSKGVQFNQQQRDIPYFNYVYDAISSLNNIEIYGLGIRAHQRKIEYLKHPNFYFTFRNDHNNRPLYWLRWDFNPKELFLSLTEKEIWVKGGLNKR